MSDAKMVDVKNTKKPEKKTDYPVSPYMESYPYGLRITLNKETLKKLGLSAKDFSTGQSVTVDAIAVVTETSDRTSIESGDNMSVSLQITKIGVSAKAKPGKDVARPNGKS